ncbi:hypothetical protein CASFOL_012975 [Castilleja foliolosa]|uniref:F-box domain-containing protein n=1 Tax=Castilleja foliolosa TaxID=1961234 RepID=A0ABD3DMP9_9LAMI
MKTQSAKRRRLDNASKTPIDRLSQLPQPVLHHILSLIPQNDAVRTCILSKSWRFLWHGRHNVELREQSFAKKNQFLSVLNNTLQRYHDQGLSFQRFAIDMDSTTLNSESIELFQKWFPIVIHKLGITSFSLKFFSGQYFSAPLLVFQSKSLIELCLRLCIVNSISENVLCRNLQTLSLHNVYIDEASFQKIMLSCPLIENLDLEWCEGFKTINLNNALNLKRLSCSVGPGFDQVIEMNASRSLEKLHIQSYQNFFLHQNNIYFPRLKCLKLHGVQLSAESFDNLSSSNFPCLNELILNFCHGFKEFLLSSRSISFLTINMGFEKKIKALIDTPNILYFEYSSYYFLPSIKFTTTTSNEWESNISVLYKLKPSDNDASSWFLKLNKLLNALSESHITLNLYRTRYKNLKIKDSYVGFYKPIVVENLRLWGYFSSLSVPDILNCLFRILRPMYIYMDLYMNSRAKWKKENNRLVEFISKLVPKETGEMRQCYFWIQDLEDVSMDVYDTKAEEWRRVRRICLPALLKKQSEQQIRFRLDWRDEL